jgi:hypothetical protein
MPLSKTIQLGVIILAIQLLRKLKIRLPRITTAAAAALAVSRKSGYQAARRLRILLGEAREAAEEAVDRRERLQLRLENQLLRFERDHPEVRFWERGSHLTSEARSLCVRWFRDHRAELTESGVAETIGVPLSSLRRWEKEADEDCCFPAKPENRGQHRRATPAAVDRVLELHGSLEQSMTLDEFAELFNSRHPQDTLDRKTITRILQAHHKHGIEKRSDEERYHPRFEVYYPGAQAAIDGTDSQVCFSSAPESPITVKQELAIDIASCAILGEALGRTETAEGVQRVMVKAREECESILAVLSDNGPANRSERIERLMDGEAVVGQIFSFPYHPETNGHIEGLFGQFSRITGKIEIDDSSRHSIALSVVASIWRIFIYFHNHSPRKRLGGLSPIEHFRRYTPMPVEVEAARKGLSKRKQRCRDLRRGNPRLADPKFRQLVEGILLRHPLEVTVEDAMKALLRYDECVIRGASNAFFVASERDGFDENKRTFAYFMGIVRNKQKELDQDRIRSQIESENSARRLASQRQEALDRKREKGRQLREQPESVVLNNARLLLLGRLHILRSRFTAGMKCGLEAMEKLGRSSRAQIEELASTIRGWEEFLQMLREKVIALLFSEEERTKGSP